MQPFAKNRLQSPVLTLSGRRELGIVVRRASAERIFLDQASWMLPKSFWKSELASSDKERIVQQLAEERADCFVDALLEYAKYVDVPLSELVSADASISFKGNSGGRLKESSK